MWGLLFVAFLYASGAFFFSPPALFPTNKIFEIKQGMSLSEISVFLKQENIILSRFAFEFCVISFEGDRGVLSGSYLFKEPLGSCAVASHLVKGTSDILVARVTIPEGSSNKTIANILAKEITNFNPDSFLINAEKKEGYLFPDTYFVSITTSEKEITDRLVKNFEKKVAPLSSLIQTSGHSLNDLVIMASIIEKEANTEEDKKIVSGILWKRIAIGMPLQVDAPFYYLLGKESSEITEKDLKMVSGYNTYRNFGLPVGPIGNPGILSLRAAMEPTPTPYLFYLSDKKGVIHYAKNFEDHKKNKIKYLK